MDYSPASLRGTRATDGLLWHWGYAMRYGHYPSHQPADPDRPRLAVTYDSRPPCPDHLLDLSRAFAALHPATLHLASTAGIAWFAHAPTISRLQLAIYHYYVAGLGLADARTTLARMTPDRRDTWLDTLAHLRRQNPDAPEFDELDGDALVALAIPRAHGPGTIGPSAANKLRNAAIERMARYLGWRPRREEDAA